MKTPLLFLLTASLSMAAIPAVEQIPSIQTGSVFSAWLRHNGNAVAGHRAFIIKEKVDKTPILPGDVLFLEGYTATPLVYLGTTVATPPAVGDAFTFIYQNKETCRVIGSISDTGVKTVLGTEVKFSDIKGVVRRIIRISDGVAVQIPVSNVAIAFE